MDDNFNIERNTMFWEMISNWRIWLGAIAMLAGLYAFIWGMSIACVLMGHGAEVCGL